MQTPFFNVYSPDVLLEYELLLDLLDSIVSMEYFRLIAKNNTLGDFFVNSSGNKSVFNLHYLLMIVLFLYNLR